VMYENSENFASIGKFDVLIPFFNIRDVFLKDDETEFSDVILASDYNLAFQIFSLYLPMLTDL
jgi:hypothetical protein